MTKEKMERGQQIQEDLRDYKRALSQISRVNIFDIEIGSGCMGRQGDSFLAEVQTEIKTKATLRINNRIALLEKEFKAL